MLFIGIGVAVIVLGVLYWAFFIRQSDTQVAEVPTVSSTPVPTPTPRIVISSMFQNTAGTIALSAGTDPFQTFSSGLKTIVVAPGQLGILTVTDASASQPLLPFEFFDRTLTAYPVQIRPTGTSNDGVILAFGQEEAFNAKGQSVTPTTPTNRLAFISQVPDTAAADLRSWESTMTDNLANLFGVNKAKNTGPFGDASYQGVNVRYKNFPNPDSTIDYALVTFSGRTYLVMTNSRQAMFAVLNVLRPLGK